MAEGHSYGPTCDLYDSDDDHPVTDDHTPPKVKAQFFYASPLPIDDPLSPLPQINAETLANQPPQPFSSRDNAALSEAWEGLRQRQEDFNVRPGSRGLTRMFSFPKFQSGQVLTPELTSPTAESSNHAFATVPDFRSQSRNSVPRRKSTKKSSSRSQSPVMTRKQSERTAPLPSNVILGGEVMLNQEPLRENGTRTDTRATADEIKEELDFGSTTRKKHRSPLRSRRRNGSDISPPAENTIPEHDDTSSFDLAAVHPQIAHEAESTFSGRPFARAPSTRQFAPRLNGSSPLASPRLDKFQQQEPFTQAQESGPAQKEKKRAFVPVGVSRLHLVEFPDLTMKPIYWSPINDTSHVIRATWFYKDSMLPVPADVANRLELGYEDMKPFSGTYKDELDACIEHGAAAEMKVVYKLWPEEKLMSRPTSAQIDKLDGIDETVKEELPENVDNVAVDLRISSQSKRLFQSYSVVYTDSKNAQILRPNALPSVGRNRKPLHALRKGRQLGIAVVRGFDRRVWEKLHSNKAVTAKAVHAKFGAELSQSGDAATRARRMSCHVCNDKPTSSKVTDLVLVIHGIGQKLSERVDSFHFTHAINGLRREFNVELAKESVRGSLKDNTGIMVLPVNWRLGLSFDEEQKAQDAENKYELEDITPETLPAIRSMISDVMLDIPYYMSHHKQKMIAAVVREANRVYRLWCKNNPGFDETGRVHLVAHSLGSAMAMDILSQQPTHIPRDLDLNNNAPSETIFEFKTTTLFCCGSPAGFFLLLHNANLIPRKGRYKPGMQHGEDEAQGVASDIPHYGCLAVDNLYNIMHKNDPIAYQQNSCVDRQYASLLEPAVIPSATQSFFTRLSSSLRYAPTSRTSDAYGHATTLKSTRPELTQLPSTVELETHNFTREEIAEKRMYLLNDNGQIDYFLSSGGGPLEIQYINMLGAHSSYWTLPDFVRFLVVEIGRQPGRENTLNVLKARKKRNYRRGEGI